MNKQTKKMLGVAFIGLATLSAGTVAVNAYAKQGGFGDASFGQSDDIQLAIENNDFDTFVDLTNRDISQDQFDMIVAHHHQGEEIQQAIDDEDYGAFVSALEDSSRHIPTQEEFEDMVVRHQAHEKVEQAIEEGNYDLWLSAIQDLPHAQDMAQLVSEDEFELLVDMHQAREDGDFETAKSLADEIGLDQLGPRGFGEGQFAEGKGLRTVEDNSFAQGTGVQKKGTSSHQGMRGMFR